MRAEPRRHAAGGGNRPQRGKLCLPVEPVARLAFEGRRPGAEHPVAVLLHRVAQVALVPCARRADGRENPAACRMQLLVARAARAQRELLDAVPQKARVRVTVCETRNRTESGSIDLLNLALDRAELGHRAARDDSAVLAQDEGLLDDLDLAQLPATGRR